MADPMKIRAQMKGDVAEIRILMSHAMETGQRKDAAGTTVPAHFIQTDIAPENFPDDSHDRDIYPRAFYRRAFVAHYRIYAALLESQAHARPFQLAYQAPRGA